MSAGKFPLSAILPIAATGFAFWALIPALEIWSYVLTNREFDPWADGERAHASTFAMLRGGCAVAFALGCLRYKSYRTYGFVIIVVAVVAVALVPIGMQLVRILPDG